MTPAYNRYAYKLRMVEIQLENALEYRGSDGPPTKTARSPLLGDMHAEIPPEAWGEYVQDLYDTADYFQSKLRELERAMGSVEPSLFTFLTREKRDGTKKNDGDKKPANGKGRRRVGAAPHKGDGSNSPTGAPGGAT